MAKKQTDQTVERHVNKGDLEKLLRADAQLNTANGDARQSYDQVLAPLVKKGLNKYAFGVVKKLYKMGDLKAAHAIRAIDLYIDMLGLRAQGDLEDIIDDATAEAEAEANGGDVDKVLSLGGEAALRRLKDKMAGATPAERKVEVKKFAKAWPELKAKAEALIAEF
jgi:hypothetical protein